MDPSADTIFKHKEMLRNCCYEVCCQTNQKSIKNKEVGNMISIMLNNI